MDIYDTKYKEKEWKNGLMRAWVLYIKKFGREKDVAYSLAEKKMSVEDISEVIKIRGVFHWKQIN